MTENPRKPRGKLVAWIVAVIGILIIGGVAMWFFNSRSEPQPQYAPDSGIQEIENGPLPPVSLGDSGFELKVYRVTSDAAEFEITNYEQSVDESVTIAVSESASFGELTITLCATWVNPHSQPFWDTSVGGGYSDIAYYVYSLDGSTPQCPEPLT